MSIWHLLVVAAFVRLNESRYRLVMRLRRPPSRHVPGTRVYRSKRCHVYPSGWREAFCPCRRELTSPLAPDVRRGLKKFPFLSPIFRMTARRKDFNRPAQSGCHLSQSEVSLISLQGKISKQTERQRFAENFQNNAINSSVRILGSPFARRDEKEVTARYFNKEYYEASLTYLVTPSDYDKLTAAYFLPREYPEDLWRLPFSPFPHHDLSLRPLITDLISWTILYRGIVN